MSTGSAMFKIFASLVWGVGTFYVLACVRVEGAKGGWWDLLLGLGLLGILQSFSFVSSIMAAFNKTAAESANTVEETIWVDKFGNVVRRETDEGAGCLFAVIVWLFGIMVTLLASALISPIVFVVNLCRAVHHFVPGVLAVILDLLIIGGTLCGTVVGIGIADKAIDERAARLQAEAVQARREADEKAAAARAEREAQMERERQEREANQARKRAESEAREAQRRAERQARDQQRQAERQMKEQQRQVERAQREAQMQERRALQQAERARKAAEAEQRRALQQAEREQKRALRNQNRRLPKQGRKNKLPF